MNGAKPISDPGCIPERRVFILSAFDEDALDRNAASMASYLESLHIHGDLQLEERFMNNLCYTLNEKRTLFDWRSYHVADTIENLQKSLRSVRPLRRSARSRTMRFLFTGQVRMAQDLMVFPLFRPRIHEAAASLRGNECPWDFYGMLDVSLDSDITVMHEVIECSDRMTSQHGDINEPTFAQSSCVAVQIALVDLLRSWNVTPTTVVGHSSGEIARAYCAGKISRQAAWKIAYRRGQELERVIAHANKGQSSGVQLEDILRFKDQLDEAGVLNRLLPVKVAYHSAFMREVAPEYLELLGDLDFGDKINHDAEVTMISPVTDDVHYRKCRRNAIIEIGPHAALRSVINETFADHRELQSFQYGSLLRRYETDGSTILHTEVRDGPQVLPAASISLGSVLSVGWVSENQDRLPSALSYGSISETLLLFILEYHMNPRWDAAQSPETCHTAVGVRSARDFHRLSIPLPGLMVFPLFSPLRAIASSSGAEKEGGKVPVTQALRSACSLPAAVEVVTKAIIIKLARLMAIPPKDTDQRRTLASCRIDSLVAVDLKAWFKRDVGANVTIEDLLGDLCNRGYDFASPQICFFGRRNLVGTHRENQAITVSRPDTSLPPALTTRAVTVKEGKAFSTSSDVLIEPGKTPKVL
ncbi:acyl transferase/acyl hydrolase/lysophospholipase [Aspergillus terricola var. indicus]